MKRLGTIWGLALMMMLGIAMAPRAAHAQNDNAIPELSRDWNVRAGLFLYQSKTTRDQAG
ncbi:MAG: hypothetical protein JWN14_5033, partial [Chthonomonadales bacterium]|nr:hypothetical protein [Chthonomonadales bacterium]